MVTVFFPQSNVNDIVYFSLETFEKVGSSRDKPLNLLYIPSPLPFEVGLGLEGDLSLKHILVLIYLI